MAGEGLIERKDLGLALTFGLRNAIRNDIDLGDADRNDLETDC